MKIVNHRREGIYTSFKVELSAFTEVVQWIEALGADRLLGGGSFQKSVVYQNNYI